MNIRDRVSARRTQGGLRLVFRVPDRSDDFVCYPKDAAQKAAWLVKAQERGWELRRD